jgi:hypothetical protein
MKLMTYVRLVMTVGRNCVEEGRRVRSVIGFAAACSARYRVVQLFAMDSPLLTDTTVTKKLLCYLPVYSSVIV